MIEKVCSRCGRIGCTAHKPKPWVNSKRRQSVVSGWEQQRRAKRILRRDDTCHVCQLPGANQVDHVIPVAEGGADDEANLRPIHSIPCHANKTAEEARRARSH